MSAYLKQTLGVRQMVTNGGQGFRALGPYDPNSPVTYPYATWMNNGAEGVGEGGGLDAIYPGHLPWTICLSHPSVRPSVEPTCHPCGVYLSVCPKLVDHNTGETLSLELRCLPLD
jgi:hypothetical protein